MFNASLDHGQHALAPSGEMTGIKKPAEAGFFES